MIRHLSTLFLCVFWSSLLLCQDSIIIDVRDINSKEPLAFANVFDYNSGVGGTTDLRGRIILSLSGTKKRPKTLTCSFVGYSDKSIDLNDKKEMYVVDLSFTSNMLSGVTIVANGSRENIDAKKILLKALKNIKNNYSSSTDFFNVGYTEFLLEGDQLVESSDAIAKISYTSYPQKNHTKKSFRDFWDQQSFRKVRSLNRQPKNIINNFNCQYYKYYNTTQDKCDIKAARFSTNISEDNVTVLNHGGPLDLLTMDKVKYKYDFLDSKLFEKYDYTLKSYYTIDKDEFAIISFKPKPISKSIRAPWGKKMKHAVLSGNVVINTKSYAIKSFSCQLANISVNKFYQSLHSWQDYPISNSIDVNYTKMINGKYRIQSVVTKQQLIGDSQLVFTAIRALVVLPEELSKHVFSGSSIGKFAYTGWNQLRRFPTPLYNKESWINFDNLKVFSSLKDLSSFFIQKYAVPPNDYIFNSQL